MLEIIRGDTKNFKFRRKSANGEVITDKASKIYFTIKKNTNLDTPIIQKTIEDMEFDENYYYHFTILPEDTNDLEYGEYVYDIEVKLPHYTQTISRGQILITEEVTFAENEV